jgi:hypothetical protein
MECAAQNLLEQHLSDIRRLAARADLASDEREAVARAEKFAISLLREHNESGHNGKTCPFATLV